MQKTNEKVATENANNINSNNGFANTISNREMYNKSRSSDIESVGFWTSDLDLIKGETTFAKAPNGTYASMYSWFDGSTTYFEKVDGRWFELDAERTESVKAAVREKNKKAEAENANYITDYPMGRDLDLTDNLVDACVEDIMNSWWEGDYWEGTFDIANTLGGVYRARIKYVNITLSLSATILNPDDSEIGYSEFNIDDYEGTYYAFEDMCNWIDGKLDEIEKNNR